MVSAESVKPPVRWPHPTRANSALVGLWVVGLVVALLLPALVVSPNADTAPEGKVYFAFSLTVVGALIQILAGVLLWRRKDDTTMLVFGAVPAFTCIVCGIILAASKLTGTGAGILGT